MSSSATQFATKIIGYPFEIIYIYVAGPLTETKNGNKYILAAVDYVSKHMEAIAIADFTPKTTAQFILHNIVFRYGTPKRILTDQGSDFERQLNKELDGLFKIFFSVGFQPLMNRHILEKQNCIKDLLSCYVKKTGQDWDDCISELSLAYNTTNQLSPFEIVYNRKARLPDLTQQPTITDPNASGDLASMFIDKLSSMKNLVKSIIEQANIKQENESNNSSF